MFKHTKSLEISDIASWVQVGKCPILEYFHEIQLVVSEYAKYLE